MSVIVSCSRRTDVPALYTPWLLGRIRAGYALSVNPFNAAQVRRVDLTAEAVSCFVFWSKYPKPLFEAFGALEGYPSYFLFTLNDYPQSIEPLPPLEERISLFTRMAGALGPHRMVWRYDPILWMPGIGEAAHVRSFARIAAALRGSTDTCVFSFLDAYAKIRGAMARHGLSRPDFESGRELIAKLVPIARENGMRMQACAEAGEYTDLGAENAACIDAGRLRRVTGQAWEKAKDKGQRQGCRCMPSVDIGAYDTCVNGCAYCYATARPERARRYREQHDAEAEGLFISAAISGQDGGGPSGR